MDIITNCVVTEGCAVNCEPVLTMRTDPAPHLMKSIEDWSNRTLPNFFSPILQERSPGVEKRRFSEFPSRLLIAPNRLFRNADWVIEEFSQPMAVEDEIDLTWMTSDSCDLEVNMNLDEKDKEPMTGEVKMLCEMGFSQSMARKALDRTRWDVEAAAE